MPNSDDLLLYVLSSLREMPWPKFKEVFGNLYVRSEMSLNEASTSIEHIRYRSLKALANLGHCDFSFDGGTGWIYSAPSVLARLPESGFPKALLCGARGPATLQDLEKACNAHSCEFDVDDQTPDQHIPFIPQRIVIESSDLQSLTGVAADLGIRFLIDPPSWALADHARSLTEYLQALDWMPSQTLDWQKQDFDPVKVMFSDAPASGPQSMRLSRYKDPVRGTHRYYLNSNDRWVQVDSEWSRYAALQSMHLSVLMYDRSKFILAAPVGAPLPSMLARAAVLCSGYVTRVAKTSITTGSGKLTGTFEIYDSVPETLAEKIASKLGQRMQPAQIDNGNEV